MLIAAMALAMITSRLTHHSLWSHEHFTGATLAQFLYVAAQCGIFAFLINYMTSETPPIPASWASAIDKWPRMSPPSCRTYRWLVRARQGRRAQVQQQVRLLPGVIWLSLVPGGPGHGAASLRRVSAHKMLGLYSVINAVRAS